MLSSNINTPTITIDNYNRTRWHNNMETTTVKNAMESLNSLILYWDEVITELVKTKPLIL